MTRIRIFRLVVGIFPAVKLKKSKTSTQEILNKYNSDYYFQGGRRYFSRGEITALVGGPGKYRHIFLIPPTAKVLPPKNEKPPTAKTLPSYWITVEKTPCFGLTASAKKIRQLQIPPKSTAKSQYRLRVPPTLNTGQKVPPTLDTAQKVPPTLDIAQKVPPILDTAEKVPRILDTAQKVPAFLFVFVLCSLFFRVLRVPFR